LSRPLFIGLERLRPERADSTNSWLRDYLVQHPSAPEGLVVITPQQTAGRGQQGRAWISEPGSNLTASVLLRPRFLEPSQLFYLNKAIALAVRDTLADYLPEACIKWPNDVYAGGRKVAGILIESAVASRVQWVIAGVGVNVNQADFGPDAPLAGSIASISGHTVSVETVLDALCSHLEHRYLQLRAGQQAALNALYHEHLLGLGTTFRYRHLGNIHTATLKAVDANGCLVVSEQGNLRTYTVGEIEWLMDPTAPL